MSQDSNLHNCLTNGHGRELRTVLVALGSNIGSERGSSIDLVRQALNALQTNRVELRATSRLWRTPCIPVGAGPDYVNAVARLSTDLSAQELLDHLHALEHAFDRKRSGRWAARTLDLDLIDYDGVILPDPPTQATWRALPPERQPVEAPDQLILPHPRLQDRGFVLLPLAEAAPGWIDPVSGHSVEDLINALPEAATTGMSAIDALPGGKLNVTLSSAIA